MVQPTYLQFVYLLVLFSAAGGVSYSKGVFIFTVKMKILSPTSDSVI